MTPREKIECMILGAFILGCIGFVLAYLGAAWLSVLMG